MTSPYPAAPFLENPYILDLFAGPGGLDVAAHMLAVPSLGIEWDRNACETRYAAGLPTWHADVSAVRRERFHELPKDLTVLAGGPPCQTYSVAGNGAGRKALKEVERFIRALVDGIDDTVIDKQLEELNGDPRTALVLEPLRYAIKALTCPNRDGRPFDVIVLEQVPGVKALWDVYAEVLTAGLPGKDGERVRYAVAKVSTLRTEAYGVPQTRRRTILMARLSEHGVPELPTPTHRTYKPLGPEQSGSAGAKGAAEADQIALPVGETETPLRPWVSMGEVLKVTNDRPQGRETPFTIVSNYGSGGDPKKRGMRADDQPAFTVTGKVSRNAVRRGDGTPHSPDRLTIPEAGILQTFPPDYPWSGGDQSQQVGNAVPPLFGMHVLAAALALPLPSEEKLRENWPEVGDEERASLRKEGCGAPDGCGPNCPQPGGQFSSSGSSGSSRPRTGVSAKRSEK
ncbi:DNA cytosine methyltransferase [Streptomyces sp. CC228A]|uniref:DNA cytosine methyltransferase n=1 Tax=Streptomyces sp. CC228A TaxID=2898186 RepID=UPI001F19C7E6|nr:DNA cytosine methyltransferase [Streptomyces sp. CC228A]